MHDSRKRVRENKYIEIEVTVRSKNGKVIKHFKKRSDSFVANYYRIIRVLFACPLSGTVKDMGGNDRTITCPNKIDVMAPEDDDSYGILIGKGTTSPTPDDYTIESQVFNDTLRHKVVSVSAVTISGSETSFTVSRDFVNVSGADQTIYEIAEVAKVTTTEGDVEVLIFRHVESGGITVPNGATLTVQIKHKIVT